MPAAADVGGADGDLVLASVRLLLPDGVDGGAIDRAVSRSRASSSPWQPLPSERAGPRDPPRSTNLV